MRRIIAITALLGASQAALASGAVDGLQQQYRSEGAGPFSAEAGRQLWTRQFQSAGGGAPRSCATCHGSDLTKAGKHARTGKVIGPMAPSVNSKRLTDAAKVKKWLRRNCHWTLGRTCTAQEKGDVLAFLQSQ